MQILYIRFLIETIDRSMIRGDAWVILAMRVVLGCGNQYDKVILLSNVSSKSCR